MVRTPLAERIHGNERLNDVYLFLPFYDEQSVQGIVDRLTSDREAVPAASVTTSKAAGVYQVDKSFNDVVPFLRGLPTYRVSQKPKASNIRRLMKLARLLSQDGIDTDAKERALSVLVQGMVNHIEKRLASDHVLRDRIDHLNTVTYRTIILHAGELTVVPGESQTVPATERDIEALFNRAKLLLTEDVAMAFRRARHDEQEPARAKVETYEIAGDQIAWREVDRLAGELLNSLFRKHRPSLNELPPERRSKYEDITATARSAESSMLDLPDTITLDIPADAEDVPKHLYVDEGGRFSTVLNDWEKAVIAEERARDDFVCWLRNFDRKSWSMSYVYTLDGEERPGYPDFIVVRKRDSALVADILEPHRGEDSVPKAKGLARYAEQHRMHVGRIEMIRKSGGKLKRLDFTDTRIRPQIASIQTPEELDHLFDSQK
jgi:type III restriction enzyme